MFKAISFGPLALALFIAALSGPALREASLLLGALNGRQSDLQWALSREIGGDPMISGPVLMIPVAGSSEPIRLYPETLDIVIDQTTRTTPADGLDVYYSINDIRMTASFAETDLSGFLREGEAPDWPAAYLRLPMPGITSLQDGPDLAVAGAPTAFLRRDEAHDRVAFETAPTGLPAGPVALALTMTNARNMTTVFPTGWTTTLAVRTDNLAPRFNDVRPESTWPFWLGRDLRWTMDGAASQGRAERRGFEAQRPQGGFLGIQMREPDGLGPTTIFDDRPLGVYHRTAALLSLVPLALGIAALALAATRARGYGPQLGLVLIFAAALGTALYLAPRFGPGAGWMAGAGVAALGGLMVFAGAGRRVQAFMALLLPVLWLALPEVQYYPQLPNGTPFSVPARLLAQPILIGLCLLALLAALTVRLIHRKV